MPPAILACEDLACERAEWNLGQPSAVRGVTGEFRQGEFVGIAGPDGCGKGLFLNLLGLLERPDAGSVFLEGLPASDLPSAERRERRNRNFGFVFGQRALLPAFTVAENVAMPLFRICGDEPDEARDRTLEVLEFCGISSHSGDLADRIPPAAQDLAALARALVHRPRILVAIRPKGAEHLLSVAREATRKFGLLVLWAGVESELTPVADRLLRMEMGNVVGVG